MAVAPSTVGLNGGAEPETVGLTGGAVPTYTSLGGTGTTQLHNVQSESQEEDAIYVVFDFIVQLPAETLKENDNLKNAIKECVDCQEEQIRDLTLKDLQGRTRVNGKIYTDNWELPQLQKKLTSIIPDHLLSSSIQRVCQLESRPLISRFYYKTSKELKKKEEEAERRKQSGSVQIDDFRTPKPEAGGQAPLSITNGDDAPEALRQKTPMKKRKGKAPGSASMESENHETTGTRQQRERDQAEQSNQNGCCVVL